MSPRQSLATLQAAYDAQRARLVGWLAELPEESWAAPSVLAGWTVRDLAFHTTEVPSALIHALSAGPTTAPPLSIADYTAAWRLAAGEIADRDRAQAAALSPGDVLDRHATVTVRLEAALASVDGDVVIPARRGPIRLSDFLITRVNELVVHSRDLSASLPDREPVALDPGALGVATRMLLGILVDRAPGRSVEVRVPPYAAVQCIAGPRHTRGTPPNVVEAQPLAWVEVACGRCPWADAIADGRITASGERSDLSAYLPVLA